MKVVIYTNGAETLMGKNMEKKFARHSEIIYNHLNRNIINIHTLYFFLFFKLLLQSRYYIDSPAFFVDKWDDMKIMNLLEKLGNERWSTNHVGRI